MDKQLSMAGLVGSLRSGNLIAFGGGGLLGSFDRKPMAAAKAIAVDGPSNLHALVFLGGPEIDLLIGLGKLSSLSFSYVGLDVLGLAPNFRRAREEGKLKVIEYSEFMILAGLEATTKRVPFMPTRHGLGTDVIRTETAPFKVFDCPLTGAPLVAVPAIQPDVAIVHVNVADEAGNAVIRGDAYADLLLIRAAQKVYLTAERVVKSLPQDEATRRATLISRIWVDGVCEAPLGARYTSLYPDYPCDVEAAQEYLARSSERTWLESWAAN
jgi:glutaconate CoA-transferase subunit A